MREALFIKRNAKKWQEYQHFDTDDPDEKADRFITLVDDLAYAKTFYPHGRVTRWINSLAVSTPVVIKRHSITVRLTHWFNVLCFVLLLMSGLAIFNAHPALYWGHYGYRGIPPVMGIGAMIEPTNRDPGRPVVWCQPAFANRSMYVRNDRELVCVSLEK